MKKIKNVTPRKYQEPVITMFENMKRLYLGDDMGLGKTYSSLYTLEKNNVSPILIFTPTFGLYTWKNVLESQFQKEVSVYSGKPKERNSELEKFLNGEVEYIITNYSYLEFFLDWCKNGKMRWGAIICDEVHLAGFLSAKRKRSKKTNSQTNYMKAKQLFKYTEWGILMTGSPMKKSFVDLFGPLSILWPKIFTSYWQFAYHWGEIIDNGFGKEVSRAPKDIELFRKMLFKYFIRRLKINEIEGMPPKDRKPFIVKMTIKQQIMYDELLKDMIIEIEETKELVISPNIAANLIRLRQILISPMIFGSKEKGGALEALIEVIRDHFENQECVAVFTPFRTACDILQKILKEELNAEIFMIRGQMKPEDMYTQYHNYNESKNPRRVMIATIAASMSWNLISCRYAYFLGCNYDAEENSQAEDRLWRDGQKFSVLIQYLLYMDTIDEDIIALLNDKQSAIDYTINLNNIYKKIIKNKERFLRKSY